MTKFIIGLGILLVIVGLFINATSKKTVNEEVVLTIEKGRTADQILDTLKQQGIIKNESLAKLYLSFKEGGENLKAGTYNFHGKLTIDDVLQRLIEGNPGRPENEVTLIEGWTIDDMADYLEEENIMSSREFKNAAEKEYDFDFIKNIPKERDNLEGYLFPDTYRIFEDITGEELVEKMLHNFEKNLDEATNESGQEVYLDSTDGIIILASIIEKELRTPEEKRRGAGVFKNRLDNNIGLQADSTINYITGKNEPRALLKDLEINNPYNTYKFKGLPPGPIANPGLASLKAAFDPEDNDFMYFLTTPEGVGIFTKTLEQHNAEKYKYYN